MQLHASILRRKTPDDGRSGDVTLNFKRLYVPFERGFIRDVPRPGLSSKDTELTLSHVEPTAMFGRVVKLKPFANPVGFCRFERIIQGRHRMGIQVVQHDADDLGVRISVVNQPFHTVREVLFSPAFGDLDMPLPSQRLKKHEQIARTIPLILVVVAGNSASYTVTGINIDKTPPVVTIIRPEGKTYNNTEFFNIEWTTTDALSGVASEAGQLDGVIVSNGQLVELLLIPAGTHIVSVQGVDKAGNAAGASMTFIVVTDINGLIASLNYMCGLGWINNQGICKSLLSKLETTKAAIERDQLTSAGNKLAAFINELKRNLARLSRRQPLTC